MIKKETNNPNILGGFIHIVFLDVLWWEDIEENKGT
jgi:hypothetical protein